MLDPKQTHVLHEWKHAAPLINCKYDPKGRYVFSSAEDYSIQRFEIPTGKNGDVYDRAIVRIEEIKQSLRIIEQCLNNMPEGDYKARHPLTTPPIKDHTMQDIETLIHHFLNVSWGPVIPANECTMTIEATKGLNSYYLVSDGSTMYPGGGFCVYPGGVMRYLPPLPLSAPAGPTSSSAFCHALSTLPTITASFSAAGISITIGPLRVS